MWLSRTPEEYVALRQFYKSRTLVKKKVFNKTQCQWLPIYFRLTREPMGIEELLRGTEEGFIDTTVIASSLTDGLYEIRFRLDLLARCPDEMFGMPLAYFPVDQATLTALANADEGSIATVNELIDKTDAWFESLPGIGTKKRAAIRELIEYLRKVKRFKKYFEPKVKRSRTKSSNPAKKAKKPVKPAQHKLYEVTATSQPKAKREKVAKKAPTGPEPALEI